MTFSLKTALSSLKNLLLTNKSNKQVLIKNTFWLGLIEILSKIILFVSTILIIRYLGPAQFGAYNFTYAYVAVFMVLSDFGLSTITTREIAKHHDQSQKYLSNLLGLKFLVSVIIFVLILLSFLVIKNQISKEIVLTIMLFNLAQAFGSIFTSIFQGWEKMELVFVSRVSYYLGILLATFSVIGLKGNVFDLALAYFFSTILTTFISIVCMTREKIKIKVAFDPNFIRRLLIETLPLLGFTVVSALYANAGTLLIGKFLGNTQVGLFQSAYKVLLAFQAINLINNAIFPRISTLFNEQKWSILAKLTNVVVRFSLIGLIPLGIAITIFQAPIVRIIYGITYVSAAPAMALLIWSGIINYFRILTSNLLIAQQKQKQVFFAVAAGFIVNLLMDATILPTFGFVLAAWAMVAGEMISLAVTVVYLIL
jgi:O-antigen/teichoic acid export membrane protein